MPSTERLAGPTVVARRDAHAGAGTGRASAGQGEAARPLRPVRVLHVVTGLEIGGTELLLHKLLGATDRARVEASVLSLRGGGPVRERIAALGIPTLTLDMSGALPTPGALARLLRVVRVQRPDVVHGWLVHGNVAATVAAAATGAPLLWSVRAGLADLANEPLTSRLVLRASVPLARRPHRILYNSARSAAEHEAFGYPADRRLVVPNGFDVERFRPDAAARAEIRAELGVAAEAPLVGLFARWHPQKDHATFLRAAARLRARRPDAAFLLAGTDVTPSNPRIAEQPHRVVQAERRRRSPGGRTGRRVAHLSSGGVPQRRRRGHGGGRSVRVDRRRRRAGSHRRYGVRGADGRRCRAGECVDGAARRGSGYAAVARSERTRAHRRAILARRARGAPRRAVRGARGRWPVAVTTGATGAAAARLRSSPSTRMRRGAPISGSTSGTAVRLPADLVLADVLREPRRTARPDRGGTANPASRRRCDARDAFRVTRVWLPASRTGASTWLATVGARE